MGRQLVIKLGDREFVPVRYDNFASLGAPVDPPQPYVAVPFARSIQDLVLQTRARANQFEESLRAQGLAAVRPEESAEPQAVRYEDKLKFPFLIFRGEKDKRYGLMPTRYRFSGEPDPLETTRERIEFEAACATTMHAYLTRHSSAPITDEQARAAARHYGAPSSFLDFSFNPNVAAFFAHPAPAEQERGQTRPGLVYSLNINHFEQLFGMQAWGVSPDGGRDIHAINVFTVWQIPYLSCDPARGRLEQATLTVSVPETLVARPVTIRTRLVPAIPRIAAQEGMFLEANFERPEDWWAQVFLWTVLDFVADKWCFLRQDFSYENRDAGVVAEKLFPADDDELAQLTKGFGTWK